MRHINAYLCLLAKRIKLGTYYDQSTGKFALADAYFFVSITYVLIYICKWFFYFNFQILCVISIIQSLFKAIWKANHPNYEEDEDQLATNVLVADVDHLVKYVTGEVPK